MSWKDQTKRRRAAERRGRRGGRRASAMLLRQVVLHPSVAVLTPDDFPEPVTAIDEWFGDAES